jgi:bifunctional non-homologous end joining protein LigD
VSREVSREHPAPLSSRPARASAAASRAAPGATSSGGIAVTHPDRAIFASPRVTKLEVVRYYERVAPAMWPHLRRRLLSLLRCPDGVGASCFFQKHSAGKPPPGVKQVPVVESDGDEAGYLALQGADGIAALAQWGHLEFHTWGSSLPRYDKPDRVVLDLDPDAALPWARVVEAALLARELMQQLGLAAFVKTTGGKGLHVVAPLKATRSWDEVKSFARAAAQHLADLAPDRFTAHLSKERRVGRIFIDYLRNSAGNTAVAAFSLRARDGAPVSMPLDWSELDPARDLRFDAFNIANAAARMAAAEQAWSAYADAAATLTNRMIATLGAPLEMPASKHGRAR